MDIPLEAQVNRRGSFVSTWVVLCIPVCALPSTSCSLVAFLFHICCFVNINSICKGLTPLGHQMCQVLLERDNLPIRFIV